jgi:hypothetical protein
LQPVTGNVELTPSVTLPKRLFATLSEGRVDLDFIKLLLEDYHASPNSNRGYPLARAVKAQHDSLIDLLLQHGANPAANNYVPLALAVKEKQLELFKTLHKAADWARLDKEEIESALLERAAKAKAWTIFDYLTYQGASYVCSRHSLFLSQRRYAQHSSRLATQQASQVEAMQSRSHLSAF